MVIFETFVLGRSKRWRRVALARALTRQCWTCGRGRRSSSGPPCRGINGYKGPLWDAWQTQLLAWLRELKLLPEGVRSDLFHRRRSIINQSPAMAMMIGAQEDIDQALLHTFVPCES